MKTKWNFLLVLVLLATLVGGSASAAQAQGGITGVSPAEGTVGTQVTITGAGFGEKHGEVLLGSEKCKVLGWSDSQITFMVDKPLPPAEFLVTVLPQGDKKPAEPLTFGDFIVRRPLINQGTAGLIREGDTATILGDFFGDKKGEVSLGYLADGVVVKEDVKVVDWSMHSIRFELPGGLTGKIMLVVRNEVGTGLALLDLDGGNLGYPAQITDPGGIETAENPSGIYYKGKFYVFSVHQYYAGYDDNYLIQAWTYNPDTKEFSKVSPSIPNAYTESPVQPLVVGDTLWVFYTGHTVMANTCGSLGINCQNAWYITYTYNESTDTGKWADAGWQTVPNVWIREDATVAPVYDPVLDRISVYFAHQGWLRWFYKDNSVGGTWHDDELVTAGVPVSYYRSHAIYKPSSDTTALVSFSDMTIAVKNGEYVGYIADGGSPSLVDLGSGTGRFTADNDNVNVRKLDYQTLSWSGASPVVDLPDLNFGEGSYEFEYLSRGAINQVPNDSGGTDYLLYILYGAEHVVFDQDHVYKWYLHEEAKLDSVAPVPLKALTAFKQVSSGEGHACAIKPDNTVECWGYNNEGQSTNPSGVFAQISAGDWHTCGVRPDHSIECWGWDNAHQTNGHPIGTYYDAVAAGKWHTCAIKTADKSVVCWGNDDGTGRVNDVPQGVPFKQITLGDWHTCGIRNDNGYVQCWGDNDKGRMNAPANTAFKDISAAGWHTCGVTTGGEIKCWGDNDASRVDPEPTGNTFTKLSVGDWHGCATKTDGSIVCWGTDDDGRKSSKPVSGFFTQIEAGLRNTCAIREDGHIICWGTSADGQNLPPY